MNKRKNYGRKIKRSKTNLYHKKKTKGQKIFGTVILIAVISAAAFVGYCLGKPLLDYLGSEPKKAPEWTPASETRAPVQLNISEDTEDAPEETETALSAPSDEAPALPRELAAYSAPSGALANKAALSAALVKAKSSGYTSVSVQLKDDAGFFHYATEIENADLYGLVKGDMTAAEIVETFLENNMVPTARISVLKDSESPKYYGELNYKCYEDNISWLDYSQSVPTHWVDPSAPASGRYITAIVTELKNAGFMNIVLENVIFPEFQPYDTRYIAQKYYDKSRYKFLYNVIPDGTILEINAADITGEELGRTAEPLYEPQSLTLCKVAVVINRTDFPVSEGNPADAANLAEAVMAAVSVRTDGLTLIPVIGSGFAGSENEAVINALKNMGYTDYMVK